MFWNDVRASTHNLVRRLALVSIVVGAAALGLIIPAANNSDDAIDLAAPVDPAPLLDVEFVTFDGETLSLADLRGRPVVVNFWASWCPACIAEMPGFEAVHQQFGDDVVFVGFAIQDDRKSSDQLAAETGVTYTLVEDPLGDFFKAYDGIAMPTTVFLTREGEVSEKWSGVLTESSLTERINRLLEAGT